MFPVINNALLKHFFVVSLTDADKRPAKKLIIEEKYESTRDMMHKFPTHVVDTIKSQIDVNENRVFLNDVRFCDKENKIIAHVNVY